MKARYFRGIRYLLECGHTETVSTSFYKLSKERVACLNGSVVRTGVMCQKCKAYCQPEKYLGTERISKA